jgi:hypothetical protein
MEAIFVSSLDFFHPEFAECVWKILLSSFEALSLVDLPDYKLTVLRDVMAMATSGECEA